MTKPQQNLPSFLVKPQRMDLVLYGALIAVGIFSFALMPFRAVLLNDYTLQNVFLTGGSFSVLKLSAENPDRPVFLALVVIVAALSMIKFLPLYYLMGRRWGQEFIDLSFANHPPLWFRKLENFIYRRLGFCLFLSFVPFSPIPATIIIAIGGIQRVKGWVVAAYAFVFAAMLKSFYVYLGLTFGEEVRSTLEVIDKYVMRITLALIAYMFISIWYKNWKQAKANNGDEVSAQHRDI